MKKKMSKILIFFVVILGCIGISKNVYAETVLKDRNKLKNKSDLNDLKTDLEKAKISANLRDNRAAVRELRNSGGRGIRIPDGSAAFRDSSGGSRAASGGIPRALHMRRGGEGELRCC